MTQMVAVLVQHDPNGDWLCWYNMTQVVIVAVLLYRDPNDDSGCIGMS